MCVLLLLHAPQVSADQLPLELQEAGPSSSASSSGDGEVPRGTSCAQSEAATSETAEDDLPRPESSAVLSVSS